MICADTNVFVDFFRGTQSPVVDRLQTALREQTVIMNPFVLSELLSSPKLPRKAETALLDLPRLKIENGFFERSGRLRRQVYKIGYGISMADIYIAQSCIDAHIPILTADRDFHALLKISDLKIAP